MMLWLWRFVWPLCTVQLKQMFTSKVTTHDNATVTPEKYDEHILYGAIAEQYRRHARKNMMFTTYVLSKQNMLQHIKNILQHIFYMLLHIFYML